MDFKSVLNDEEIEPLSKKISERQIERLRYVGSNETTGEFYRRKLSKNSLKILSNHLVWKTICPWR
ncbi:MAG: hypothetical protein Ct9H300mP20_18260 [Gammaproteobacteria bacterium]|nr:MAG: hypothetical protein Ct9H300mP20_18260 [Gammaproteobacteria bacterium]